MLTDIEGHFPGTLRLSVMLLVLLVRVVHTHVPLSPNSIIWYWSKCGNSITTISTISQVICILLLTLVSAAAENYKKNLYRAYSHRVSRALMRRELINKVQKGRF